MREKNGKEWKGEERIGKEKEKEKESGRKA